MGSVVSLCKKAALETLDILGLSEKLVTGEPVAQALNIWDNDSLKDMALTFGVISDSKLQLLENESERLEQVLSTGQGRAALGEVASQWREQTEPLRILQPAVLRILSKGPLKIDPYQSLSLLGTIGMLPVIPGGVDMLQQVAATMGCASNEPALVIWDLAGLIADGNEAGIHVVETSIRANPHLGQCLNKALDWIRTKWANTTEDKLLSHEGLIQIMTEMVTSILAAEADIPRSENR